MARNSGIDWTDHTWNPWQGCRKVSPGCANCYMYRDKRHFGQDPTTVVRSKPATFNAPLKWKDQARVFVCSWSDFFIEDADPWRGEVWQIMRQTPHLTYMLLTKRLENISARLPDDWPLKNIWLGVTAENQEQADKRIPTLLKIPAAKRFVSVEPMLELIDLKEWVWGNRCPDPQCGDSTWDHNCQLGEQKLHWVICGGETGPNARPMHPEWVRSLRNQCKAAEVSFYFKGWGEWLHEDHSLCPDFHYEDPKVHDWQGIGDHSFRVSRKKAGRLLDGREWNEVPLRGSYGC